MSTLHPWQFLLITLAGWINRNQQDVIDYLLKENRVLKRQLRGRRLRLTDDERRRLAVKGKALGRQVLQKIATIVTPDTILAWYRKLVVVSGTTLNGESPAGLEGKRRPPTSSFAWPERIRHGATRGFKVRSLTWATSSLAGRSPTSSREHGIEPTFERAKRTPWRVFLRAHWDVLAAADFFTIEVARPTGLVTYYVLFVMELKTRRVHVAGLFPTPDSRFMLQTGRGLTDAFDGFLLGKRFLILDRDAKYTDDFRELLVGAGVRVVRLPVRSPKLNAYAERFVLSIKSECLDRMIFFTEASLRRAVRAFVDHYHRERCHQGLDNQLIEPVAGDADGKVRCRERLGGLLRYYYRQAA